MGMFLCALAILAFWSRAYGIDVNPNMRSFSSAIKGGSIASSVEKTLYEHNTGNPGVITEQWFTGIYYVQVCIGA